eukprot:6959934-Prymnesium_polylepis.1
MTASFSSSSAIRVATLTTATPGGPTSRVGVSRPIARSCTRPRRPLASSAAPDTATFCSPMLASSMPCW